FFFQFAKRDGLRVIAASTGSDNKVQLFKDLGADVVFNYKITKISEVLAKGGGELIDMYVPGGRTLGGV
ncbi:hypothetical protein J3R82DRAFT_11267, partial [Butyriboletus roseoflavus]